MSVLLNTPQAAARCNLSPRTLEKLRVTGGGPPFIRLGGSVRYQVDDLEAWIAAGRRLSTSDTASTATGSPASPASARALPRSAARSPLPEAEPVASAAPERRASSAPQNRPPSARTPRGVRRSPSGRPLRPRRS
jgi:hypothetical protein